MLRTLILLAIVLFFGSPAHAADATVAQNGDGQFKSIQDAINAAPQRTSRERPWVIHIKPGVYKEILYVQREKRFITLVGDDPEKTILTYNLHANMLGPDGRIIGTFRTASTFIDADDFTAESLTFENSAGPVGQALAIRIDGDRAAFLNCRFLGWQDTILANRGRHYFQNCYIAGHVDFIFGGATAFFENCHIHCLRNGYITAASTPAEQPFGFVFAGGTITGENDDVKTYLGRPWREFASTIFINTKMSDVVRPEGWHNWDKPAREKTSRYAEFKSTGAGGQRSARVAWSRQLSSAEAKNISVKRVLGGVDGWNPKVMKTVFAPVQPRRKQVARKSENYCSSKTGIRRDLEYGRAGGERLLLDACVPEGPGPFPAVILVHGGDWTGGDKSSGVDPMFGPLSKAGIAWFSINYRLAPKHRYPAAIQDVQTAIRWLKEHAAEFRVDPRRIALLGESAGGNLVALAVMRAQSDTRVAAAVSFYAPIDLEADTERRGGLSPSLRALFERSHHAVDAKTTQLLHEASPINHVHPGLPPFLLVHGTADMSVPYLQSVQLRTRLLAAGAACDLITIDDGVHGMAHWKDPDADYADRVVKWITARLRGSRSH